MQSCVHCVRGGILYMAKHGLAFELVVQFLGLEQLPVLLLVCLGQFLILSAQAVMVEIHASRMLATLGLRHSYGRDSLATLF